MLFTLHQHRKQWFLFKFLTPICVFVSLIDFFLKRLNQCTHEENIYVQNEFTTYYFCPCHTVIRNSWQHRQKITYFVHRVSVTLSAIQTYERGTCKNVRAVMALACIKRLVRGRVKREKMAGI